jgi:hypothetical protein
LRRVTAVGVSSQLPAAARKRHKQVTHRLQGDNFADRCGCEIAGAMSPTAVVQLAGQRLELVRHPLDGRIVAFDDADAAFAFAVSLELRGAASAGTVAVPAGEEIHMLDSGSAALDLATLVEHAA